MSIDSILLYVALTVFCLGVISLLYPLRFLRIRSRKGAALICIVGLGVVALILALPVRTQHTHGVPGKKIDEWMPAWQFMEQHETVVYASPEKIFAAIHTVRAREIWLFQALTTIRRCGREGPESILNAPEEMPLLEIATRTTFVFLTNEAPREIVLGTVLVAPLDAQGTLGPDLFRKKLRPGVVLATMDFVVTPEGDERCRVSTETRVHANTTQAARRFAVYWRFIHPGSDIIRRSWLRAIKQRAEAPAAPG